MINRFQKLLFSGALGLTFVGVTQFLQLKTLDIPLTVSLYCFAAALPLTASGVLLGAFPRNLSSSGSINGSFIRLPIPPLMDIRLPMRRARFIETTLGLSGLLLSFVGMGAIFWHFALGAAVLFLSVSTPVLGYVAYILFVYALFQLDDMEGGTDKAKSSPQD